MSGFTGYKIQEELSRSVSSVTYRGYKDNEHETETVILKVLNLAYPSAEDLLNFKREFQLIKSIDFEGIVKARELLEYEGGMVLVLEDFQALTIKEYLAARPLGLDSFLNIALQLAEALSVLHSNNIIHGNLKPVNILINVEKERIKLTDFGLGLSLARENERIYDPQIVQGSLCYVSPEQTGRMNRTVDYRSDLYSLGVTFYEMLVGEVPFKHEDPLELIHSHIARLPRPPQERNHLIPGVISNIVMKLLVKNPEERYQSCFGLLEDLKECRRQRKQKGFVSGFVLARRDLSARFKLPSRIYGREEEIKVLRDAAERVRLGGMEAIFVSGFSGIGKSALIHEAFSPLVFPRAYFIHGKFDNFRNDAPCSALIQAFRELIRLILRENKERIDFWKEKLLQTLGEDIPLIAELIPELELITGARKKDALAAGKSRSPFNQVFPKFMGIFASAEYPMLLFLDDLQWADQASLNLMKRFFSDGPRPYFLFVAAFRTYRQEPTQTLLPFLDEMGEVLPEQIRVVLEPLPLPQIQSFLGDALSCPWDTVSELARQVHHKAGGNPFFTREFLRSLYREKLLAFDPLHGWNWDISKISAMSETENVVALLARKITRLPRDTQELLKFAACIGHRFPIELLSRVYGQSMESTSYTLSDAMLEHLILVADEKYRFVHDKIHEAVYSLIPDEEKKAIHYKIGRLELEATSEGKLSDKIFKIVKQLNVAVDLAESDEERIELANLNLIAGRKARSSSAYDSALIYLRTGMDLLGAEAWRLEYDLTYDLHLECLHNESLAGEMERAQDLMQTLLKHAHSVLDKADVYNKAVILYAHKGDYGQSVDMGLAGLQILGVNLSESPGVIYMVIAALRARYYLRNKTADDILSGPECLDPKVTAQLKILHNMGVPAYFGRYELAYMTYMEQMVASLRYGNTPFSAHGFGCYAVLKRLLGDTRGAFDFGMLALKLNDRFKNNEYESQLNFIFGNFNLPFLRNISECYPYLKKAYTRGVENGDFIHGAYALSFYFFFKVYQGESRDKILDEMLTYSHFAAQKENRFLRLVFQVLEYYLFSLKGETLSFQISQDSRESSGLIKSFVDEAKLRNNLDQHPTMVPLGWFVVLRMQLLFLLGRYEESYRELEELNNEKFHMDYTLFLPFKIFYGGLTCLALCEGKGRIRRRGLKRKAVKSKKKLKRLARNCPDNFSHMYLLLEAELARVSGKTLKAMDFYNKGIRAARENGYPRIQALGEELAGRFYLTLDQESVARAHIRDAFNSYRRWGAEIKIRQLEEEFPMFFIRSPSGIPHDNPELDDTTRNRRGALDLSTVLKASQAISGEIVLESLLSKMMRIALEAAGAEKGYLIIPGNGELFIEAEGSITSGEIKLLQSIPIRSNGLVAETVIQFVERTQEDLVLHNASGEGLFAGDAFIRLARTKSLLCMPITHQGDLKGLLYLTNDLAAGAFTSDRLEILRVIASQMAISLENAGLYAGLEEKVKDRTAELRFLLEELKGKETELRGSNEKLRSLDKMKSDFFANISHEFRTPLTLIITPLESLLRDSGSRIDESFRFTLKTMFRNSQLLLKNINNLLELSRLDANRMHLSEDEIEMVSFSQRFLYSFEPVAREKGVLLKFHSPYSEIKFRHDESKLEQILLNLLSNAFKFTEKGSVTMEVGLLDDSLFLKVRDTGPGIPQEDIKHVFERFHQGQGVRDSKQGTGIGLALARELTLLLRGELNVVSNPGQGAEFVLMLPLERFSFKKEDSDSPRLALPPAVNSENRDHSPINLEHVSLYTSEFEDKSYFFHAESTGLLGTQIEAQEKVLVVEDNDELRNYIISILKPHYLVRWAADGREALLEIESSRPDIVITDIMMPYVDGLELLQQIRSEPITRDIPVLLLSARSENEFKLKGLGMGADDYIQKPFHDRELLLRVQNLANKIIAGNNAVLKERESIYADLHDHLGSELTDLTLLSEKNLVNSSDSKIASEINRVASNAMFILRDRLLNVEDNELLAKNFISGLNLVLLRRYSNVNRIIIFESSKDLEIYLENTINRNLTEGLYTIIKEMTTNDLKYGCGNSRWKFELVEDSIEIHLSGRTNYEKSGGRGGRGANTIINRLAKLNGTIDITQENDKLNIKLKVPLY